MIKAIIIDDEASSIELITNLLQLCGQGIEVVATGNSVASGYEAILNNPPNLIFLDIEMKDGTGFDLLKKFETINFKIIFITAHQEFAIDAFKFSAIDYLLKPLSPLDFMAALKKAERTINSEELNLKMHALLYNISNPQKEKKKIVLKTLERVYAIYADEIVRFEADGSYTTVHLTDGKKITVSRAIKEFDEMLSDSGFLRVHQSHLVHTEQIFCFEKAENHIIMKNDEVIPVSLRKKDLVIARIQLL